MLSVSSLTLNLQSVRLDAGGYELPYEELAVTAKAKAVGTGAKDRALDYVKSRVLTGEFPGGHLISEGEIAAALGMSRTPVREAFLRLEAEGLLRLYPKRGALIVPVSPDEIREVMEARLVLEQFAAEKIIHLGSATQADSYTRLAAELERQRRAASAGEIGDFLESDRNFHAITIDVSRNSILGDFYGSLRDRQMRMIGESTLRDSLRLATIVDEHQTIAEAIRDGDALAVRKAIEIHHNSTARALGLAL
jgi:DNA-binding GntR family transcriptional regulator